MIAPQLGVGRAEYLAHAPGSVDGRARKVYIRPLRNIGVMEDDQQTFALRLASEDVVLVFDGYVFLQALPQRRMFTAQLQQILYVRKNVLLLRRAASLREGVIGVAGKAAGEISAIVGIIAA